METNNIIEQKLRIYQNANNTPESIKQNFVIRTHEYELIIEDLLKKKRNDSIQHELILGRRGSGKSTLLKRIQIEIDENTALQKKYVAINLPEEQGRIYRLFDLWETVYDELCEKYSIQNSKKDFDEFEDDKEYTNYIFGLLHELLDKKKLIAVLLLDNFDRILDNIKEYANILRETLLNYNDIKIIAGSTRMTEHFWKYDYPFYEFFRVHRLGALTSEEIKTLLKHWSKILEMPQLENFIYEKSGQLEAIRILTDGLPRTLQFFIKILIEHNYTNGYDYLNQIFDKVSPLYQERLDKLTPSHRKIVMEMAFIWHGCTVQELVDKCKMESKLISANLKQLDQYGIVETRKTGKKNNIYLLAERFFNIWLLGTQGNPSERRKAKYLTIFLENFYSRDELKELVVSHIKKLQNKELDYNKALLHSKALAQSKYITIKERDNIIELTECLEDKINDCKIELPEKASKIFDKVEAILKNNNFEQALVLANEIEQEEDGAKDSLIGYIYFIKKDFEKAEGLFLQSIEKGLTESCYMLAVLYYVQENFKKAEYYYLIAYKQGNNNALYDLANLYENKRKLNKAEQYYLLAIEKENTYALNDLANLYVEQNEIDKAEKYYLLAIEKNNPEAVYNLAILYDSQNKLDKAEKYYLLAGEKGNIKAMNNLAVLYANQNKFDKAEKYYLLASKKGHINSTVNLALLYEDQGKLDKAEQYYLLASEKGDIDSLLSLAILYEEQKKLEQAEKFYLLAIEKENVSALNNLALLYEDQKKVKQAEQYYLLAIKKGDTDAINNLAILYKDQNKIKQAEHYLLYAIKEGNINAINNLALLYEDQNKFDKAEKYFLLAIEKGIFDGINNLALLYEYQNKFDKAEKYFLLAIEKGNFDVLYNLATFYEKQNRLEDAEKYYLLSVEKNDIEALNSLAILYENQNKLDKAEQYYLLAIEKGNTNALNNLAVLYDIQEKQNKAKKYYLLASEKGDTNAIFNLALLYYKMKEKEKLLNHLLQYDINFNNFKQLKIISSIWNGNMDNIFNNIKQLILGIGFDELGTFLINLLIHHQQNILLQLFEDTEIGKKLKESYIPIYYTILLLKDKQDVIALSIPNEIKETVDDLIKMVKNGQKYYYS